MKKKQAKPKSPSEVVPAPLTQPEFEQFLRKVTRPVKKPQPEPEKPKT